MRKIHLNRTFFAALHQKIVEKCYPDEEKRAFMWEKTETAFYGLSARAEPDSICDKMNKALETGINGRALYNYKTIYNKQLKEIPISDKHLKDYLTFIESNQAGLLELAQAYKTSLPGFPPKTIRQDQVHYNATSNSVKLVEIVDGHSNLKHLCNGPWWFYFYEYKEKNRNNIIRLILTFKKEGDDQYSVELKNSGPPYTDFSGWITQATDDNIVCALTGKDRSMTIMFSVEETGLMDIYPGIYLKHDSNYHLHSGSVFIHRVPPNSARPLQVQTFEQGSTEIEHAVPKSIADFFTEKRFVYIKTPKRFSDDSLSEWLIKKKESRNEIKDIDLFVSATILSAKEKMDFLEEIKSAIGKTVLDYIKERSSAEVDQKSVEDLLKRIGEAQELDLTNQFPTEGVFADYRTFHAEVQNMIKGLAARVEEIDENRISFSFQDLPPTGFIHQEPKIVMERDFRLLKRSKGLLVICPFNRVFSSCWVLVSRAITLGIPTFLVFRDEQNLPFILQQANVCKIVHMKKLTQDNLQSIPLWFKDSNFGPIYFRSR